MLINVAYYGPFMIAVVYYPEFFTDDVVVGTCLRQVTLGCVQVRVVPGGLTIPEEMRFETHTGEYLFFRPVLVGDTNLVFVDPKTGREAGRVQFRLFEVGALNANDPRYLPFPGITMKPRFQVVEVTKTDSSIHEFSLDGFDFEKGRALSLVECIGPATSTITPGVSVWERLD